VQGQPRGGLVAREQGDGVLDDPGVDFLDEVQPLGDRHERGRVFRCETCDDRGDAR
jgi:hypothetical protein